MADGTAGAIGGGRGVAAAGAERESARDTTRAPTANHDNDKICIQTATRVRMPLFEFSLLMFALVANKARRPRSAKKRHLTESLCTLCVMSGCCGGASDGREAGGAAVGRAGEAQQGRSNYVAIHL